MIGVVIGVVGKALVGKAAQLQRFLSNRSPPLFTCVCVWRCRVALSLTKGRVPVAWRASLAPRASRPHHVDLPRDPDIRVRRNRAQVRPRARRVLVVDPVLDLDLPGTVLDSVDNVGGGLLDVGYAGDELDGVEGDAVDGGSGSGLDLLDGAGDEGLLVGGGLLFLGRLVATAGGRVCGHHGIGAEIVGGEFVAAYQSVLVRGR